MTWSEANEFCTALDPDKVATLTSIRSQEEQDFVFSLISYPYYPWLGGTDEDVEGEWRWVNLNIRVSERDIMWSPISRLH